MVFGLFMIHGDKSLLNRSQHCYEHRLCIYFWSIFSKCGIRLVQTSIIICATYFASSPQPQLLHTLIARHNIVHFIYGFRCGYGFWRCFTWVLFQVFSRLNSRWWRELPNTKCYQSMKGTTACRNASTVFGRGNNVTNLAKTEFWHTNTGCQKWSRIKGALADLCIPWYLTSLIESNLSERTLWYGYGSQRIHCCSGGTYNGVLVFPVPEEATIFGLADGLTEVVDSKKPRECGEGRGG